MTAQSLAQPARTTTPVDRIAEGRGLYAELGHTFRHDHGAWIIPSRSVEGKVYEVRLGRIERCECPDYQQRGARCAHVTAATLAESKSRICSCCGQRVLGRFLSEVQEDDELLSWFVGDEICCTCIKDGYWS